MEIKGPFFISSHSFFFIIHFASLYLVRFPFFLSLLLFLFFLSHFFSLFIAFIESFCRESFVPYSCDSSLFLFTLNFVLFRSSVTKLNISQLLHILFLLVYWSSPQANTPLRKLGSFFPQDSRRRRREDLVSPNFISTVSHYLHRHIYLEIEWKCSCCVSCRIRFSSQFFLSLSISTSLTHSFSFPFFLFILIMTQLEKSNIVKQSQLWTNASHVIASDHL